MWLVNASILPRYLHGLDIATVDKAPDVPLVITKAALLVRAEWRLLVLWIG